MLRSTDLFFVVLGFVVYTLIDIQSKQRDILKKIQNQPENTQENVKNAPVAWVRGKKSSTDYLKHIKTVFKRVGYDVVEGEAEPQKWDVFWSHEYPFTTYKDVIQKVQPTQLVNHIPGSSYYTFKVFLATAGLSKGIPKSFALPQQSHDFKEYAKKNPKVQWVQKSNAHREIRILKTDQVELSRADSFVQEYVSNPLLIDGKKFDLGIYTVVTSLSPLRVYIYENEILLRFCPKEYHPFDANDLDKYVVADDYTPIWEMPSFNNTYNTQTLSFKNSLAVYLESQGKSINTIMDQIRSTIREVFERLNQKMTSNLHSFENSEVFFELSRFDFLIDEDLNVYLMEANMSPNLSSQHFKPNALLYEQLLINMFSLLGISNTYKLAKEVKSDISLRQIEVPDRSLFINLPSCNQKCKDCPETVEMCQLCANCMPNSLKLHLENAYYEHLNRREMKRVAPSVEDAFSKLTKFDRLQQIWFKNKCLEDKIYC
ncbi:unnamed protein product [Bursaphelenchus okinawaensis]|uniref:Uncharacterized protein n=1 Tax=Bursaphelenchus okinawaensis TaxID=465554 RepID=A0A811LEA4_9BILA|nr:unnamed protein product [Bursaphelenchus okinawaensis]CAG9122248.1 unnamed protein product [Bursaphelenchus okinawaensis]